jgi:hypothetical protein
MRTNDLRFLMEMVGGLKTMTKRRPHYFLKALVMGHPVKWIETCVCVCVCVCYFISLYIVRNKIVISLNYINSNLCTFIFWWDGMFGLSPCRWRWLPNIIHFLTCGKHVLSYLDRCYIHCHTFKMYCILKTLYIVYCI